MKTKGTEWFETWFNTREYLELYKHRDNRDARRVVKLIFGSIRLNKDAKVLDLACGNGRHSQLFAKKGFDTLGIDLSPFLIKQAKEHAGKEKKLKGKLRFEIRDMRKLEHYNEFDLVVNLFSSFGYFDKDRENEKVITSISRALKKGGFFFFDFLNSRYLEKSLVPFSFEKRKDGAIIQLRYIKDKMCYKDILIFPQDGKDTECRFSERVRLFSLIDFKRMLGGNSLKILQVFGDYDGGSFSKSKSERLIIIAQKI